jgi:hypothetical protein
MNSAITAHSASYCVMCGTIAMSNTTAKRKVEIASGGNVAPSLRANIAAARSMSRAGSAMSMVLCAALIMRA